MGLRCVVFGHEFERTGSENKQEQEDDSVVVEVSKKVCTRCGKKRSERRSTRVRESESKGNTTTDNTTTDNTTTDNTTTDNTTTDNRDRTMTENRDSSESESKYSSGYSTPDSYEERANAGIVMEDNLQTGSETTEQTDSETTEQTEDDRTSSTRSYRKVQGEDAYISSNSDSPSLLVSCDRCEYEQYENQVSRESGDICHKCGGWISVENTEA